MGPRAVVIVPDTNVLVSGLGWDGPERELLAYALRGMVDLALSPVLMVELERVLSYPKFDLSPREIEGLVTRVKAVVRLVNPERRVKVVTRDPSDDRVLECAIAADAEFIASGDRDLLNLGMFEGITILKVKPLLRRLAERDRSGPADEGSRQ